MFTYAYSTGSLKDSFSRSAKNWVPALRGKVQPTALFWSCFTERVPVLLAGTARTKRELPAEFGRRLVAYGHTVEMATVGMDGAVEFLRRRVSVAIHKTSASFWILPWRTSSRQYAGLLRVWRQVTAPRGTKSTRWNDCVPISHFAGTRA